MSSLPPWPSLKCSESHGHAVEGPRFVGIFLQVFPTSYSRMGSALLPFAQARDGSSWFTACFIHWTTMLRSCVPQPGQALIYLYLAFLGHAEY